MQLNNNEYEWSVPDGEKDFPVYEVNEKSVINK